MKELLFFGGFLSGMVVTGSIFLWDDRIKARRTIKETKVWDEEDCYVCACGKVFTPDDLGHSQIQVGTSGFRCVEG